MISSVDKTVHYLHCVTKDPHTFEFAGQIYEFKPKETFTIRPSTFYKDECLSCGQCCRNYDTVMFPSDMDEIKRRAESGQEPYQFYLDNCEEFPIKVDRKQFKYYSVPPMTAKDSHDIWVDRHTVLNCRWIFLQDNKKLCKIHEYRCITCGFPHMELYSNHQQTHGHLGHKQFGRNQNLGCKVDIKQPLNKETLEDNIYWLTRLQTVADYFGLRTYLPEIIDYLKSVNPEDPPVYDKIFRRNPSKRIFQIDI